jgi:hypothetical protein
VVAVAFVTGLDGRTPTPRAAARAARTARAAGVRVVAVILERMVLQPF